MEPERQGQTADDLMRKFYNVDITTFSWRLTPAAQPLSQMIGDDSPRPAAQPLSEMIGDDSPTPAGHPLLEMIGDDSPTPDAHPLSEMIGDDSPLPYGPRVQKRLEFGKGKGG